MATDSEKREKERRRLGKALLKEAGRKKPDLRLMRQLLEQGAYTDLEGVLDHMTAVARLARRRNLAGVRLLIEFGADLDRGLAVRPIIHAITNKDHEMVKLLVKGGAAIGIYGLSRALERRDHDTLRLLLDLGVQGLGRTGEGTSINLALNAAEKTGDAVMVGLVREAVVKYQARAAPQAAAKTAAATAADPREQRFAELEQQIRDLAAALTAVRQELADLKNPQQLDKKKLVFPEKPSPWHSKSSLPRPRGE